MISAVRSASVAGTISESCTGSTGYSLRLTMLDGPKSDVGIDFHQTNAGIGAEDVRYLPVLSH